MAEAVYTSILSVVGKELAQTIKKALEEANLMEEVHGLLGGTHPWKVAGEETIDGKRGIKLKRMTHPSIFFF